MLFPLKHKNRNPRTKETLNTSQSVMVRAGCEPQNTCQAKCWEFDKNNWELGRLR